MFARLFLTVVLSFCSNVLWLTEYSAAVELSPANQNISSPPQGRQDTTKRSPTSNFVINSLSEKERIWLRDHPIIRVVQDTSWYPIEFVNESGEPSGMAGDYLRLIEQRLNVKFELVRNLSWQEAYARLKRWEIDMTTSVAVTPERTEFWAFTKPYMSIPIVIVTHTDVTYIANMRELAGKKIAVVDGYAVNDWIPRDFPEIKLFRVKTAQEGLETLQRGEVFAYIDNMLVVGYYMAKMKTNTLKIAGETPYVNAQCMAVRKDWSILAGILQKALDSISETERNDIYKKWLPIRYEHGFNYILLWQALAIFTVIFIGLVLWIQKLSVEIRNRKKAEVLMQESEEQLRVLSENLAEGMVYQINSGIDGQQRIFTYLSPAIKELHGLNVEDVKQNPFLIYDQLEEKHRVILAEAEAHALASRSKLDIDLPIRLPSGEVRWRRFISSPRMLANGSITWDGIELDITEHKQAEEVLKERDIQFQKLSAHVPGMIYQFKKRPDGTYCVPFTTDAIKQIFGCSPQDVREDFSPIARVILSEDFDKVYNSIESSAERMTAWQCEYRVQIPGQPIRWMFGHATPEQLADGSIIWYGFNTDITNIKQVEANLQKSEVNYRRSLDDSPLGVRIVSTKGETIYANREVLNIYGYKGIEELQETPAKERYTAESYAEYLVRREKRRQGEFVPPDYEISIVRKDGAIRRLQVYRKEVLWNGEMQFQTLYNDITERKRAEEDLKESKALIEAVVENVPLMIFLKESIDLRFVIFNRAGEELLGYNRRDLMGKNNLDLFPPEQADHFMVKDREVLDGDVGMLDIPEEPIMTAKKGQRFLHTRKVCIRGSDGATKYLLGISEDITERKQAEERLKETLESLRKAVSATIQVMVSAVESRDPYTAGHQSRSADLARAIANEMGLPQDIIDGIRMAGSIHDIGKISIPAEILSKPTKLSEIEYALIKEHAKKGFEMLKDVESTWPLAEIVYQHHERMDGSGYPRGMRGEEILIEARILAVADVVESMASYRPYRPALGLNAALTEIENNKETLYDADAVDACLRLFREKGFQFERHDFEQQ